MSTTLRPSARPALDEPPGRTPGRDGSSFWSRNALGLVSLAAFVAFTLGMVLTGHHQFNADQLDHGARPLSLWSYLGRGHVWEALFENWESEFLQMAAYVFLTAYLIQRGSAESKDPDEHSPQDEDPREADLRKAVPWPVRRGGIALRVYEHSLGLAFTVLFLASVVGHALGGVAEYNSERLAHGASALSTWEYLRSAQFWFESLQNWQSEFLAVLSIVVLTIFLRERGSAESKPVAAPHSSTGS